MATGGSIEKVSLAGNKFSVAADNDATIDNGGFSGEIQMNGDGTPRDILTRKPWKISGLQLSIDFAAGDLALLQSLANQKTGFAVQITLADDSVFSATGRIVGDGPTGSTQSTMASVDLAGGGELT